MPEDSSSSSSNEDLSAPARPLDDHLHFLSPPPHDFQPPASGATQLSFLAASGRPALKKRRRSAEGPNAERRMSTEDTSARPARPSQADNRYDVRKITTLLKRLSEFPGQSLRLLESPSAVDALTGVQNLGDLRGADVEGGEGEEGGVDLAASRQLSHHELYCECCETCICSKKSVIERHVASMHHKNNLRRLQERDAVALSASAVTTSMSSPPPTHFPYPYHAAILSAPPPRHAQATASFFQGGPTSTGGVGSAKSGVGSKTADGGDSGKQWCLSFLRSSLKAGVSLSALDDDVAGWRLCISSLFTHAYGPQASQQHVEPDAYFRDSLRKTTSAPSTTAGGGGAESVSSVKRPSFFSAQYMLSLLPELQEQERELIRQELHQKPVLLFIDATFVEELRQMVIVKWFDEKKGRLCQRILSLQLYSQQRNHEHHENQVHQFMDDQPQHRRMDAIELYGHVIELLCAYQIKPTDVMVLLRDGVEESHNAAIKHALKKCPLAFDLPCLVQLLGEIVVQMEVPLVTQCIQALTHYLQIIQGSLSPQGSTSRHSAAMVAPAQWEELLEERQVFEKAGIAWQADFLVGKWVYDNYHRLRAFFAAHQPAGQTSSTSASVSFAALQALLLEKEQELQYELAIFVLVGQSFHDLMLLLEGDEYVVPAIYPALQELHQLLYDTLHHPATHAATHVLSIEGLSFATMSKVLSPVYGAYRQQVLETQGRWRQGFEVYRSLALLSPREFLQASEEVPLLMQGFWQIPALQRQRESLEPQLCHELTRYALQAQGVGDERGDVRKFWTTQQQQLPGWSTVFQVSTLLHPSTVDCARKHAHVANQPPAGVGKEGVDVMAWARMLRFNDAQRMGK